MLLPDVPQQECLESLGMDGAEYCRGYIQNWLHGATIPSPT